MKLSTRVRYGVRAMIELAKQTGRKPVPLHELAKNQTISAKYLEQMATSLKIAGLIESVRGAEGGYRLARPATDITVWDIYSVLDVAVDLSDCHKNPCGSMDCSKDNVCAAGELWHDINVSVAKMLKAKTLRDLVEKEPVQEKPAKMRKAN